MAYIEVIDTYKRYKVGENTVVANNGINFTIEKGEFVGNLDTDTLTVYNDMWNKLKQ